LSVDQDADFVTIVTITARLRKRHVTDTVTGTVTLFAKYTNAARDERKVGRARVRARERRSFFSCPSSGAVAITDCGKYQLIHLWFLRGEGGGEGVVAIAMDGGLMLVFLVHRPPSSFSGGARSRPGARSKSMVAWPHPTHV
jgi:hypothetical protein